MSMIGTSVKDSLSLKQCTYFPACQGCSLWDVTYSEQARLKISQLQNLFLAADLTSPVVAFESCGMQGLRHRVDFTLSNGEIQKMGFYDHDKNLIDIDVCLQLSPPLQSFFAEFRQIQFPIKKGSVRLRVGPKGLRGCWLDFSNLDIKHLLEEKTTFARLLEQDIFIEVGQKGKRVQNINGTLKLTDPQTQAWFETYDANSRAIPLLGLVSDFTQPSWYSAKKMVEIILGWTESNAKAIEFGPGLGQFTLPLLAKGCEVAVYESEASATEYLLLNAKNNQLDQRLKIHLGDYQNKSITDVKSIDFAIVNPPRSGLKKFTSQLIRTGAKKIIYVSCFPESMVQDLVLLINEGYQVKEVNIVDQFPQTKHYESCVLLQRVDLDSGDITGQVTLKEQR